MLQLVLGLFIIFSFELEEEIAENLVQIIVMGTLRHLTFFL
jgi:hypothetical protein